MSRLFLLLLLSAAPAAAASIQQAVERAMATPPFHRALWFVAVEDDRGRTVYAHNAGTLAIPASVRKLFSAAAAAECLGLGAQLMTEVWRDGDDVIVRGDGDPSLGSERYGYSPARTFEPLILALRDRGIRRVRDVIVDVSAFDRVTIPYQWKVGNLPSDDAAPVDAIAYRENEVGGISTPSPALFMGRALREELVSGGIAVDGQVRVEVRPRQWRERIAVLPSPYIHQLLTTVLKNSHNLYTEMLFKRSGGGTYSGARHAETEFLTGQTGVASDEFRFVDGSGLAPDDLVTATAVIKILRWMDGPSRRGVWWDLLAQPGGDGTLRSRLLPLSDRLRGKTGSVAGVNSLAGIVRGRESGRRYFAVIINHHTGSGATRLIDAITEAIADF